MTTKFPIIAYVENKQDNEWMQMALQLAERASQVGEVPVGGVLVQNNQLIGQGSNNPIGANDPSAHAEMQAIRAAALAMKNYRLTETTSYVTLQPCLMCLGAILHARVSRVVIGSCDSRFTTDLEQPLRLFEVSPAWHGCRFELGCLAEQSSVLFKSFFQNKRTPREQVLMDMTSLLSLPNVNKSVALLLEKAGFVSGTSFIEKGLDLSVEQLHHLIRTLDEHSQAKEIAILKSLCDYLKGEPNRSWKAYLHSKGS